MSNKVFPLTIQLDVFPGFANEAITLWVPHESDLRVPADELEKSGNYQAARILRKLADFSASVWDDLK